MKKTEEEIREAALSEYADSIYPFNDKVDAFVSGAKWMQEQDNWISVEDRLPEFDRHVFVFCKIYGRYLATYTKIDPEYNWGEWRDFNNKSCLPPTHWQPLPEPPKH